MNDLAIPGDSQGLAFEAPFFGFAFLWLILTLEAFSKRDRGWGIVSLVVYMTVALWYAADLFITPALYESYPPDILNAAFVQVCFFLIAYRLWTAALANAYAVYPHQIAAIPVQKYLRVVLPVWLLLVMWGVLRMDGDVAASLWPLKGRNGPHMWGRGQLGGSLDALVSVGGYVYMFVCAVFGVMAVVSTTPKVRTYCVVLILVSWPYFFFLGARNQLLAVIMPGVFAYLFIDGRVTKWRALSVIGLLIVLNHLMLAMLQFRQTGFQEFVRNPFASVESERSHEGLNMIEELAFMNLAHDAGVLKLALGTDYLAHAATVVPRVVWPDKPRISADYSKLRGQAETAEGAVTATIATGLIGQGFINFGPVLGPIAAAGLMALYAWWLCLQWRRRNELPRLLLFLLGIGLLPNLGREFTLLVLWPLVFAYVLVRVFEYWHDNTPPARSATPALWRAAAARPSTRIDRSNV